MKKVLFKLLYILAILVLLAIFVGCFWKLGAYFLEGKQTQDAYNDLSDLVQQARPSEGPTDTTLDWSALQTIPDEQIATMPDSPYIPVTDPETGAVTYLLPEFKDLYAINSDVVGWISIPGTSIDYPVVQSKDRTDYYLYRDFYGNDASRGCIYAREQCDVFKPSDNIVLYGHMMKDGTMFADLANYTSKEYWQEHQTIQFDTLKARHTYQIICVFRTTASAGEGFPYHLFVDAQYDSDLDDFWDNCRKNAYYDTGLSLRYGDKLITLSTCEYTQVNGRLVIVAKRID